MTIHFFLHIEMVHGVVSFSLPEDPLFEAKVRELPGWLSRRSKNPVDWGRAASRVYWRWALKWYMPKYCGVVPYVQFVVALSSFFYFLNYPRISMGDALFLACWYK